MLISEVIQLARDLWREKAENDIFDSAQCIRFINQAIIRIRSRRNDSLVDDNGNFRDYVAITATTDTFPLDVRFSMSAAKFLVAYGFSAIADLENKKAVSEYWMQQFEAELAAA